MRFGRLAIRRSTPSKSEKGVTGIEYALIASLIAAVIVTMVALTGISLGEFYDELAALIPPP